MFRQPSRPEAIGSSSSCPPPSSASRGTDRLLKHRAFHGDNRGPRQDQHRRGEILADLDAPQAPPRENVAFSLVEGEHDAENLPASWPSPSPRQPLSSSSSRRTKRRSVAVQTEVPTREYISPQARASQAPEHFKRGWLHRPKTVCTLCLSLGLIFLASHFVSSDGDAAAFKKRIFYGSFAAVSIFLVFATLQLPDGFLVRPSPIFWRFVKGCSVLYLLLLVFLIFQDLDDVRQGLKSIDPSLGRPLPEKNYAHNCHAVSTLKDSLDVFVVAHFLGWLVKALIIRDARLLWILSILFEFMEISLRHILPNFWECWWDHLILDVFGCNLFGLYMGLCLCRYFQMKEYRWHRWEGVPQREGEEGAPPLDEDEDSRRVEDTPLKPPHSSSSFSASPLFLPCLFVSPLMKWLTGSRERLPGAPHSSSSCERLKQSPCAKADARPDQSPGEERTSPLASSAPGKGKKASGTEEEREEGLAGAASGGFRRISKRTEPRMRKLCGAMPSHLRQFTPYEWTGYRWPRFFSSASTFASLLLFCVAVTLVDLNVFFLKAELWIEPSHWLILLRLTLWTFMAAAGTREYYDFVTDPNCKKMGVQCWIDLAVVTTETLLASKWYFALQPHEPCPTWILCVWTLVVIGLAVVILLLLLFPCESSSSPPLPPSCSASFSLSSSSSFLLKSPLEEPSSSPPPPLLSDEETREKEEISSRDIVPFMPLSDAKKTEDRSLVTSRCTYSRDLRNDHHGASCPSSMTKTSKTSQRSAGGSPPPPLLSSENERDDSDVLSTNASYIWEKNIQRSPDKALPREKSRHKEQEGEERGTHVGLLPDGDGRGGRQGGQEAGLTRRRFFHRRKEDVYPDSEEADGEEEQQAAEAYD